MNKMPSNRKLTKLAKELNVSVEEIKRRYERCNSCYWFDAKAGSCDHCAYGDWWHIDYNCKEPHEVACDCVVYVSEKDINCK